MPNVPYSYEVNGKLVKRNGSLIPISSLTKRSLLPSLTVLGNTAKKITTNSVCHFILSLRKLFFKELSKEMLKFWQSYEG